MALIPPPTVNLIDKRQVMRDNLYAGADTAAVRFDANQPNLYPMPLVLGVVSQDRRRFSRVQNNHIDISVIIQIVKSRSPTTQLHFQPAAAVPGDVYEFPFAVFISTMFSERYVPVSS